MKKLFTLIAALLLTATTSFAQHNIYCWGKDGWLSIESASEVDSLTFGKKTWLFEISKPVSLGATTNSFQGTTKVALNEKVKSIDVAPEVGICYSDVHREPTREDASQMLGETAQEYSFTIENFVNSGTTYYYRTYVRLLDEIYYGEVSTVTTMGEKPADKEINGHRFVDLGLPSGLLWAETNVGAAFESADGDYFSWGETEENYRYAWDTYKWGSDLTKYNHTDNKRKLDAEDDVATVKWGEGCHIPSISDFQELYEKCEWTWQTDYQGGRGYLVKSTNGKSIFLPAAGYHYMGSSYYSGTEGYYWTSSRHYQYANYAYELKFTQGGGIDVHDYRYRYNGYQVRPVAEK